MRFKKSVQYVAGAILSRLLPSHTLAICKAFTMPEFSLHGSIGPITRSIRYYLGVKYKAKSKALEQLHEQFWSQQKPTGWFNATNNRLNSTYIPAFGDLVAQAAQLIEECGMKSVVEFGTGNGGWLSFLQTQWSTPNHFLGLDLAREQIVVNQKAFSNLHFETCELSQWVASGRTDRTVFVTHCGVLEYLSESSLKELIKNIVDRHTNSILFGVEPIAIDFDPNANCESQTSGTEFSFSHPYPRFLQEAGFVIQRTEERTIEDYRMLCLTALHPKLVKVKELSRP